MNDVPDSWMCEACNGPLELIGVLGQREHARCRACGLDHNRATVEVDEGSDEPDMAQEALSPLFFEDPIVTRPGESLIDTVQDARLADEEEPFNNDMKGRG